MLRSKNLRRSDAWCLLRCLFDVALIKESFTWDSSDEGSFLTRLIQQAVSPLRDGCSRPQRVLIADDGPLSYRGYVQIDGNGWAGGSLFMEETTESVGRATERARLLAMQGIRTIRMTLDLEQEEYEDAINCDPSGVDVKPERAIPYREDADLYRSFLLCLAMNIPVSRLMLSYICQQSQNLKSFQKKCNVDMPVMLS
ncbi:hypothetical protein L2E82_32720 [Cichorium intybus]|uniref:Uncharacterized protein n=1 Tax=Cichorium intybus TaxID=13427 RepID=A0ACB9BGR6_CICIN|nr:hypothetical protein L2E82_32720 [Cichorium intybus]